MQALHSSTREARSARAQRASSAVGAGEARGLTVWWARALLLRVARDVYVGVAIGLLEGAAWLDRRRRA